MPMRRLLALLILLCGDSGGSGGTRLGSSSFPVLWSSQWPSGCPISAANATASYLQATYGITANSDTKASGDAVATIYPTDNSTGMGLGLFPWLDNSGRAVSNGGIPPAGNLTAHLLAVRADVARMWPEPSFSASVVLDLEAWSETPLWADLDPGRGPTKWQLYRTAALSWAKSACPAAGSSCTNVTLFAAQAWERSVREFMEETLLLLRKLRPRAKFGYFGLPSCKCNQLAGWGSVPCPSDGAPRCTASDEARSDRLGWLYQASGALYPAIYLAWGTSYKFPPRTSRAVAAYVSEAVRARNSSRSLSPVLPVAWDSLDGGKENVFCAIL